MSKAIVILGASGVGKTYALKKVFNVEGRNSVMDQIFGGKKQKIIGKYQYLPELTGNIKKLILNKNEESYIDYLKNELITITDVNPRFKTILLPDLEKYCEVEYLILYANEDEIKKRLMSRNSSTHSISSKDKTLANSLKDQEKLMKLNYKKFNQEELILYLKEKIKINEQKTLF